MYNVFLFITNLGAEQSSFLLLRVFGVGTSMLCFYLAPQKKSWAHHLAVQVTVGNVSLIKLHTVFLLGVKIV